MASTSTKSKTTDAPEYEPERLYSVQLTEAVEHPPGSGQMFSPANPVQVKGKLAATWGDKVSDAQPV
ncbi:hypothetical protein [Methylobacterium sp. J-090]|uniref:hypothetical protein n=1 Tax=Methylobacterium sp. J-090 TaxID=2836666 RepID=UPI001FB9C5E0|nr:hypothetical protein [Methylobacterium sp. J-090]MCJ2080754.1 hypothetical protein [Methylobacterium sp. J-090]USU31120.1 hypothetical protein NG677_17480 [Methylobacterium sp. OTU13CASTA1]